MDRISFTGVLILASILFLVQQGTAQQCQYNGYCYNPSQCCSGVCRALPGDLYRSCRLPASTPQPTPQQICESSGVGRAYCINPVTQVTGCCNAGAFGTEDCCRNAGQGACCRRGPYYSRR